MQTFLHVSGTDMKHLVFDIDLNFWNSNSFIFISLLKRMGVSGVLKGVVPEKFSGGKPPDPHPSLASLAVNSNSLLLPAAPALN